MTKKTIGACLLFGAGVLNSPVALAMDDDVISHAKAEKVLRAVYDIERAYLRYHAKSNPLNDIPSVVSPLFPQYGFEPTEPSLKWKVIRGSTSEEVKLCFVRVAGVSDSALTPLKIKAKLLERDYVVDSSCLTTVGVATGDGFSKVIKRASIATANHLPKNVEVLGLNLYADKPALTFKSKTGKWSAPQMFLVYDEKPVYNFEYNPLLLKVEASDQFYASKSCYSSFFENWCYVSVYYMSDPDSPSKLGTVSLTFADGQKGLISVKGDQQLTSKPSKKFMQRARGW